MKWWRYINVATARSNTLAYWSWIQTLPNRDWKLSVKPPIAGAKPGAPGAPNGDPNEAKRGKTNGWRAELAGVIYELVKIGFAKVRLGHRTQIKVIHKNFIIKI